MPTQPGGKPGPGSHPAPIKGNNPGPTKWTGFHNIFGPRNTFLGSKEEIDNLGQLADYLVSQGFTKESAAGIASTVAGESTGNPEWSTSVAAGLIQWTPPGRLAQDGGRLPSGHPDADMLTQAEALIRYAQTNPNISFSELKQTKSASLAADLFSKAEAPLVPGSDERKQLIPAILKAMGAGPSGSPSGSQPAGVTSSWTNLFWNLPGEPGWIIGEIQHHGPFGAIASAGDAIEDVVSGFAAFLQDFKTIMHYVHYLFMPSTWLRVLAGVAGLVLVILAAITLYKAAGGSTPKPMIMPVPV